MTDAGEIQAVIRSAAQAGRVVFWDHARQRMDKRGADVDDVMEVLLAAEQLAATDHHPDRWQVTGTDLSGDRLSVVVQVQWLDDLAVVTVF